ncbi:S-layer homology domain-containing protein [Cohnella soli]|uniref:S-layer homology domain-containing protein n=1 Tax=Cohnella soli TaxID=425005 RepID=A0ABW0HSV4_9BACL
MKKIFNSVLAFIVLFTFLPSFASNTYAAPNAVTLSEQTTIGAARVTFNQINTLVGTLDTSVIPAANLRYNIERVNSAGVVQESNLGQSAGISVGAAGTAAPLTISGVTLYKGINKITLYNSSATAVQDVYYIEVRDANYFSFPSEQYLASSARIVLDDRVNLSGTINNVIGSSISYSVYQIVMNGSTEDVVNKNENQNANITLNGNSLNVLSLQLFPGLNKITFKGLQGLTEVSNSIYIEYRNSPTLYDLKANIDGQNFDIQEVGTTVINSTASRNRAQYDISITGKAPNADRVTVISNGNSYSYTVSSTNGWQFAVSPVNVKKGKNTITIRVYNKNQMSETTRDIAFYNGEVTFYDLQLQSTTGGATPTVNSVPLDNSPNFSVKSNDLISVTGRVILPYKEVVTPDPDGSGPATATIAYYPDTRSVTNLIGANGAKLEIQQNNGSYTPITDVALESLPPTSATQFVTVKFSYDLPSLAGTGTSLFNTSYSLRLHGFNWVKSPNGMDETGLFTYRLRNSGEAFISQVNYLTGYSSTTTPADLEALTGSSLNGSSVFSLPIGVEFLIANPTALGTGGTTLPATIPAGLIKLASVKPSTGSLTSNGDNTGTSDPTKDYSYLQLASTPYYVTKTVDGKEQQFLRVFMKIVKLPTSGGQTLTFALDNTVNPNVSTTPETANINLLFGPFARFNKVFDGMKVDYDTTISSAAGKTYLLDTTFNFLKGELVNVSNPSDIRYKAGTGGSQTVFFYINNIEVKLDADPSTPTKFTIDSDPTNMSNAFDAIFKGGDNTFRFVFRTAKNNYEKTMKVTLVPTNLPQIPVPGSTGVFPYSVNSIVPIANDPKFEKQGTIYTTKEAKMNIYGSFDFIDLGSTQSGIDGILNAMSTAEKNNYKIKIVTDTATYTWTLNNKFESADAAHIPLNASGTANPDVAVYYNLVDQTFAFMLQNQNVPADGSSKVYNIYVYNSGESGPKAQYRLEIDPTSIPYTVLAPVTERRTMNQNYVEVILTSPGAEKVTINKIPARKITYLNYANMIGGVPEKISAFSALVTGLKPNKDTSIDLVISRGTESIKDSFKVKYASENIPGAQYMEQIKKSHKLFEGKFSLTLPSTNLIRRDYNTPENLKGQVYTNNNILFGIANPADGVLDRNDFTAVPANYDLQVDLGNTYFSASFPSRFIKVSPVFWTDAGQADNQTTAEYDPTNAGIDPYPIEVEEGAAQTFYYNRDSKRELVPAKRGTLTLTYDNSVRQGASTVVTVFRFDPFAKQWENIGGVVNEKKASITVPFDRFGYYVVAKLGYGFNDVNDHPYARDSLEAVYSKGVMNAEDPTGVFGTDLYVTRGEFTRMIVKALDMPLNYFGEKHFIDATGDEQYVNMNDKWDFRYIETAARAGFVRGSQPRVFEPYNTITRQDATVMLAKALNLKLDTNTASVQKALQKAFIDEANISFYAKPSVAAVIKKGFIKGTPRDANDPKKGMVFEPQAKLLRSDAAIIISKVMIDLKKLPKIYM